MQPTPNVLGAPANGLLGRWGGSKYNRLNPTAIANLAAWYDVSSDASTTSSLLRIDASNRVSLLADRSGNSGTNCLCLNGVAGNYASAPDSAAVSITGDIDLRVEASLADWTPSAANVLLARWSGGASDNTFIFRINTSGGINLTLSQDGLASLQANSSLAVPVSDFGRIWVRATWRASDGRVQFFTSSNGTTWAQLGTDATIAYASLFNGAQSTTIGARGNSGTSEVTTGQIYRAQIYNGIAGTLAFDANFATFTKLASSGTESSSNAATVTINSSGDLGARISGERDLVQLTASKQPVYLNWAGANYGYNGAINGNAFSTPDSVANSTTGDLEVIFDVTANDYSQAGGAAYAAKYVFSTNNRSWRVIAGATRIIQLTWSPDGTGASAISATFTDHGTANFTRQAFKVTLDVDNGAGGWTARLFKAPTYAGPWAQVGSDVTGVGVTSIFDSTAPLEVGSQNNLAAVGVTGAYHYFSVSGTINGAPVAIFDPSRYQSGTTFTASTGEVWTLNGGATIVTATSLYFDGSDDYMKAAAFSLSQPETVYFTGQQVSWTASDSLYDGFASTSMRVYGLTSSPNLVLDAGGGAPQNNGFSVGTRGLLTAVVNGASSALRVNRVAAATGNAGAANAGGFTLGSRGAADSVFANMATNEVAIYAAAHDTATVDRWALYASAKWRISGV